MSREGIGHALSRLRDERDRITAAMLELDRHPSHQLLKGATLAGETRRRWEQARQRLAALWQMFDAYQGVLGAAEEYQERHPRPDQADLAELSRLLSGPSVELPTEQVPLGQRTLLQPTSERLTLEAVVARMTEIYEDVAALIAAVDTAWSALLSRLAEADAAWRAVEALSRELAPHAPPIEPAGQELAAARQAVRSDPLAFSHDGRVDTSRLDRLIADLATLRDELERARQIRDDYDTQIQRVTTSIEQVRAEERAARATRAHVLTRIAAPTPAEVPNLSAALDDRLAALGTLRGQGSWSDLAARLVELERAAATALDRARATHAIIRGLLERRNELRGRLDAYAARAGRLGRIEDAALTERYRRARELLWTAPCDLRQATVAVASYVHAVTAAGRSGGEPRDR